MENLKTVIHTILHGTKADKAAMRDCFFYIADTPQFMKDLGLKGEFFSARSKLLGWAKAQPSGLKRLANH